MRGGPAEPGSAGRERGRRSGKRGHEVLYLERGERLELCAPPGAERDGDPGDRRRVGRLDDVHEVERPEGRPLVEHLRTELFDVTVHLAQAFRVRLERLDALRGQARQHDVNGHRVSFVVGCPTLTGLSGRDTGVPNR